MHKAFQIFVQALPVLLMIGLIPFVVNEYILTVVYVAIIITALALKRMERDLLFLAFGSLIMTISESLFISMGVETFQRHTLFGLMPLWLPFLWGYGFVAIKRSVGILA